MYNLNILYNLFKLKYNFKIHFNNLNKYVILAYNTCLLILIFY